jgi:diguanylate cyclase (GGDEF)-like protein
MMLLTWYRERVRRRTDSEHVQALLRVAILGALLLHTAWLTATSSEAAQFLWAINLTSIAVSVLLFAHVLYRPDASPVRRILGALHDNGAMTLYLYLSGPMGALAVFVYSFVTVGNGFRFGVPYLVASGIMGALGMAFLLMAAPGWTSFGMIGAGLLLSHIVVTLYTGALLRRLHETQVELERLATCDPLTGLPNRRCFMERLRDMASVPDHPNIAVIYLDLDGFKAVNDSLGHLAGDELLVQVARRLLSATRGSDTVARLGGDEFTVLLDAPLGPDAALVVAARIIASIEKIQFVGGRPVRLSASIGLSFAAAGAPVPNATLAEELLRTADEAMYVAKRSGKGRCQLVDLAGLVLAHAA